MAQYDKQKIIDALRYDSYAKLYQGDLARDASDCLETMIDQDEFLDDFKTNISGDILAQLPEEDFLADVIDQLRDLKGLKKAEILDKIGEVIESLETIQQMQGNATGYAFSIVRDLK